MATIRPLQTSDLAALRELFRSFPHKESQQRFQGIDAGALADFFTEAERTRLQAAAGPARRWIGEEHGVPVVFAGLQADEWHSRFYPFRFGRVAPLLTHRASTGARYEMIHTLIAASREAGFGHVSVRIDGSEYDLLHLLQSRGYLLVDCSMKLSAPLARIAELAPPSRAGGMAIREYRTEDLPAIREIAAGSHSVNHFYNDPHLGREETNRLFAAWVERCCAMSAATVFVLTHRERPCGFAIYLNPAAFNRALGAHLVILDFVCVAPAARGGGVGRWFISQTLRRLGKNFTMVELRTSENNYAALGCYEALGMQIISSDFILHRHEP